MTPPVIGCDLYRFLLPEGWREYISGKEIGLAADNLPAWMWIYPHQLGTIEEVESELEQGSTLNDIELTLEDIPKQISKNAVAVNFNGLFNGKRTRGRLIGTLAPSCGGVFIFAATNSDEFFNILSNAADAIAREMQYI